MQTDTSLIKDRLDIAEIVGEYVQLKRIGTHLKARCPFHEEKTPSFIVNEDRGTYHCFGCQKGGDVIAFLMEIEGMEFREALTLLAERAGIELATYTPAQQKQHDQKNRAAQAMQLSVGFYEGQLWSASGAQALAYLRARGLSDATIKKFHLGYAPDGWQHTEDYLLGLQTESFAVADLVQAGLSIQKDRGGTYDRFRHRVMFPIFDVLGRPVGYSARVMPGDDDAGAKYINTPESVLYHKSDVLYGIDLAKQAIKKADRAILVEGNADVIAAHEAGIENVVAVSGTALTQQHIKILKRYTQNFVLFFDGDSAGQAAAYKSAQMCLAHDVQSSLVTLSGGKDAADLVREDRHALTPVIDGAQSALVYFTAQSLALFDVADPHGKRQATDYLLDLIVHIDHPVEQEEWIQHCAESLGVDVRTMQALLVQKKKDDSPVAVAAQPAPQDTVHTQGNGDVDREPLDHIAREMTRLALAFPAAWKVLVENASQWDVMVAHSGLKTLVGGAHTAGFDALTFLEKYYPGSDVQYPVISAYGAEYVQMHGGADQAHRDIIMLAQRAQKAHDKSRLIAYTAALKDAEVAGDMRMRDEMMQKIISLTRESP